MKVSIKTLEHLRRYLHHSASYCNAFLMIAEAGEEGIRRSELAGKMELSAPSITQISQVFYSKGIITEVKITRRGNHWRLALNEKGQRLLRGEAI